ncbi:MAG: PHP domain-containing protein [Mariniphaga sp.]|nr:PHP domain-containing protein [Mariniphaga sp.]
MVSKNMLYDFFPGKEELTRNKPLNMLPDINGHIHTPHSFSAFTDMEQAFRMAKKEGLKVLGINDFYTTDGYEEFALLAQKYKIFPLFNIEFMALQKDLLEAGIRVNDPNNPGRTYLSGKGLNFPVSMSSNSFATIKSIQDESNQQTYEMIKKLNAFVKESGLDLNFDAKEMHNAYAKNLFRERHIAQAIRIAVFEKTSISSEREKIFQKLFSGKKVKSSLENIAALENEIRGSILKAGGSAFVEENPKAFLSLEEVNALIIDAGGIPCYPVLLDNPSGKCTDYESDKEKFLKTLLDKNIYSIELIPGRNDFDILKDFVTYFHKNRFVITFGTEHNTPQLDPMKITCRGGVPLDDELRKINYKGAAIIATHQYLKSIGEEGYLSGEKPKIDQQQEFIKLGKAVIEQFISD